jgi:hypothetical protein
MNNKAIILKDTLPLISIVGSYEEKIARKNGIPLFKGILHELNDDGFGNPLFKKVGENTIVVGGAILALERLCNTTATFKPATLNTIYSINQGVSGNNALSYISCFGVGTGGSALDFGNIQATDIKAREVPSLIPLRYGATVTGTDSDKYFLKKLNGDGTTYSWYLKEFSSAPVIKSLWKDAGEDIDGTEITTEIYNSVRTEGIESFAEFIIKLNADDVREYFSAIADLDMARYNSLGLFTGQKVDIGSGVYDYVNVRLFSYLNFDNKSVRDRTETEYRYRIYSLI